MVSSPSKLIVGAYTNVSSHTVQPVGIPLIPVVHEVAALDFTNVPVEETPFTQLDRQFVVLNPVSARHTIVFRKEQLMNMFP